MALCQDTGLHSPARPGNGTNLRLEWPFKVWGEMVGNSQGAEMTVRMRVEERAKRRAEAAAQDQPRAEGAPGRADDSASPKPPGMW